MPFNGSGGTSQPAGSIYPATANTLIESAKANASIADIYTMLASCIVKDGQTTITANIPMSGYKLTGLGAGATNGDAIRWQQSAAGVMTTTGDMLLASAANTPARLPAAATVAAHATTMDPWVARIVTLSGGAVTFTDIADADFIGQEVLLVMNAAHVFTDGAVFDVQGGANYTAAAGDLVMLTATAVDAFDVTIFKADGTAVAGGGISTVPRQLENVGLSVAMAANAVTIALKGADGNDPSSSNLVGIGFRNATLTNGQSSKVQVAAATSVAISAGSTGGSVSAEASRVWIAAINNAGTVELAWSVRRSGTSVLPVDEGNVISTTAEGGVGAADTAGTWYSTTARSNVPFTILGYFDSTQATAGTWASNPDNVVVDPKRRPGDVIQSKADTVTAASTITATIPYDDTIPQNGTDGATLNTVSITPTSKSNILDLRAHGQASLTEYLIVYFAQDAVANALWASSAYRPASGASTRYAGNHRMLAGTVSATSLKLNIGASSGNVYPNSNATSRILGGAESCSMVVEEICA